MRASHASAKYKEDAATLPKAVKKEKWERGLMVKGRNESATIPHVAHVIARVKGLPVEAVSEA
jgi:TatD DNase family protein